MLRIVMLSCSLGALIAADPTRVAPASAPVAAPSVGVPGADPLGGRDLIILDNKQSIVGTIAEHTRDDGFVVINTGSGTMRIRKERIATIVLGLEGQLRHLDTSDLPSLVALAKWCLARGHEQEALAALDRAVTMPGVDLETRGLHATLVDGSPRGPKAALPLYRRYKADGGNDVKILARLQELEDALSAHNDELKKLGMPPESVLAEQPLDTTPKAEPATANSSAKPAASGLEAKGWQAEDAAYSNPVDAKLESLPPEEGGSKVLSVASAAGGKKDKAAVRKLMTYAVDENSVMSMSVRDRSEHPVKMALAIKTVNTVNGKEVWNYFESPVQSVAPSDSFKELRFDLKANTFKSAATAWENRDSISNLDAIREIQVLIYNGAEDAVVQIRGMGFVKNTEL